MFPPPPVTLQCRFESSSAQDDEATLMKLLEVIGNCMRCGAGPLLTDDDVWNMCQCCFRISRLPHASHLMARMAEATLSHIVRKAHPTPLSRTRTCVHSASDALCVLPS